MTRRQKYVPKKFDLKTFVASLPCCLCDRSADEAVRVACLHGGIEYVPMCNWHERALDGLSHRTLVTLAHNLTLLAPDKMACTLLIAKTRKEIFQS